MLGASFRDRRPSGSFTPGLLAPKLWLTSDAAKITHTNGLISAWADKSGNGYDFAQATDANKPYWARADSLENRLLYSETISSWTPSDATYGSGKIQETATTATHYVASAAFDVVKGAVYNVTIRVGAAERTWAALRVYDGTNTRYAWLNLSTGAAGTTGADLSGSSAVNAGGGYWDWTVTWTAAASGSNGNLLVLPATADNVNSYLGTLGSGILFSRAHFRRASTSSTYLATTTFPQYAGLSGRSVVYFPGMARYVGRAHTAALDVTTGSGSYFIVYASDGGADSSNVKYFMYNEVFNTSGMNMAFTVNGYSWIRTNQAGANTTVAGNTAIAAGVPALATFVKTGTSGQWFRSGTTDNAAGTSSNSVSATADLRIGHESQALQGYLPEIIVFDRALSYSENMQLTNYLKSRWGIG